MSLRKSWTAMTAWTAGQNRTAVTALTTVSASRAFLYDTYRTVREPIYAVRYVFCRASTCYTARGGCYEDVAFAQSFQAWPGEAVMLARNSYGCKL